MALRVVFRPLTSRPQPSCLALNACFASPSQVLTTFITLSSSALSWIVSSLAALRTSSAAEMTVAYVILMVISTPAFSVRLVT